MARRKDPSIPDALLDQLLAGADPKTAFDPGGLDRRRLSLYAASGNGASKAIAVAHGFRYYSTQRQAEPLGDGTFDDLDGYDLLR